MPASSWECRAARSRQARPEEAQEPSWGSAKGLAKEGAALNVLPREVRCTSSSSRTWLGLGLGLGSGLGLGFELAAVLALEELGHHVLRLR